MIITVQCPSCETSFPVDTHKVPEGGVDARCSVCAGIFPVDRPPPDDVGRGMGADDERDAAPADEVGAPVPAEASGAVAEEGTLAEAEPQAPVSEEETDAESEIEPQVEPEGVMRTSWDVPEGEGAQEVDTEPLEAELVESGAAGPETVEADVEDDLDLEGPAVVDDVIEGEAAVEVGERAGIEGAEELLEPDEAPEPEEEPSAPVAETHVPPGAEMEVVEPDLHAREPDSGTVPEGVPAPSEPPSGFQFGKRDPHEKAQRLARVLVSDMIMYNPERHGRALDSGTLEEDFEDEIRKSWDEYVDQVGQEMAESTTYFSDALNDILARGESVFEGNPPL